MTAAAPKRPVWGRFPDPCCQLHAVWHYPNASGFRVFHRSESALPIREQEKAACHAALTPARNAGWYAVFWAFHLFRFTPFFGTFVCFWHTANHFERSQDKFACYKPHQKAKKFHSQNIPASCRLGASSPGNARFRTQSTQKRKGELLCQLRKPKRKSQNPP